MATENSLGTAIQKHRDEVLDRWLRAQAGAGVRRPAPVDEQRRTADELLARLARVHAADPESPEYDDVRAFLADVSRKRALQGYTPRETALFVFSLKEAVLPALEAEAGGDAHLLANETARINKLIDSLGLSTFETFMEGRERYIREQQRSILELSTPVVEIWQGILALPLVGTVDTARTQQMMESLLARIVETQSAYVIIDITGVPLVDTAVAKHLLQTATAARLLGAECIIVGISPRIAQTLVHLGVDLSQVKTGATLAKGLAEALAATGQRIVPAEQGV